MDGGTSTIATTPARRARAAGERTVMCLALSGRTIEPTSTGEGRVALGCVLVVGGESA